MDLNQYTPPDEQVRRYWRYGANALSAGVADDRDEGPDGSIGAHFDRWLAAHDARVKAEAAEAESNEASKTREEMYLKLTGLRTEAEILRRQVEAVRALHSKDERGDCNECDGMHDQGVTWPCKTIRVLDADKRCQECGEEVGHKWSCIYTPMEGEKP